MSNVIQRADRMLVHGIVVIHVELGLRDNAAKLGQETAQHTRLIQTIERQTEILAVEQNLRERSRSFPDRFDCEHG